MAGSNPFDQFDVMSPMPLVGPPAGATYSPSPAPAGTAPAPFILPSDQDPLTNLDATHGTAVQTAPYVLPSDRNATQGQNPYDAIDPPGGHPGQAGQFVYPSERDPFADLDATHKQNSYNVIDPPGQGGRNPFDQFDHPASGHQGASGQYVLPSDRDPFTDLDAAAGQTPTSTTADVAKSASSGLAVGTAAAAGAPGGILDAIGNASGYGLQRLAKWSGLAPSGAEPQSYADIAASNKALTKGTDILPRTDDILQVAHDRAGFANGGVAATSQGQKRRLPSDVYADALDNRLWRYDPADGRVKMEAKSSARPTPKPHSAQGLPPSVQAALDAGNHFARGGAVGLPQPLFPAAPLPSVATPGLASPHALVGVHHRLHFADGGLPHHVLAALGHRPHFLDGGGAGDGDGDGSSRSGGSSGGGDNGGDGHGSGDNSSSSSSGSSGGVGGFGGGGSDGYGGGSSSSSSSGGSSGGVGGFGGGSSDGYGGGSTSTSSSSTQSSGGFSSGTTSGADSGAGGSVSSPSSSTGTLGGSAGSDSGGYGNATSGPVGSISGSVGAPAAGGFSNESAPATGGFGNFGSTPTATSNPSGLTGATPSASMMSGQTAAQSMSNEAANSGGEAGEDGTGSMSGPSTAGAFGSFGSVGTVGLGTASPYGSMANAQNAFGSTPSADSTTAAPSFSGYSGLSADGQALGVIGTGGVPTSAVASPGAYGLSTSVADGPNPGFDNFSSTGAMQQSMLGQKGYVGADASAMNPTGTYSALGTTMNGQMAGALMGGLPTAEGTVASSPSGVASGLPASVSAALTAAPAAPTAAEHGYSPEAIGGMFGDIGSTFGGLARPSAPSPASPSPYGTLSQTPMGPLNVGPLSRAMSTDATGTTAGLNADGDPTAVNGTSALTIHGTQTEAAQGAYDAPGAATSFGGITDQQAFNAHQNVIANGYVSPQDSATLSGYGAQQAAPPAARTVGLPASVVAALGTAGPTSDVASPEAPASTPSPAPAVAPDKATAAVTGMPTGSVFSALHTIEGGVLNGQPDPNNPSHYGPAQFSQGTFSDTAQAHPELGIGPGMSMFNATAEQYAAVTQAHWGDIGTALTKAGLPDTPGNRYAGWNLGVTGGIRALQAGPNASLTAAGISPSIQAANPSIYGGVQTVGQLQAKLDGLFSGTRTAASTTSNAPASVAQPASPGFNPSAAAPTSAGPGITFNGPATPANATSDATSDPTTPDGTPAKHLQVPNWAGNGVAGIAAGSLLGPVGSLLGAGNAISGFFGGPTAADGINAALAHPGAPTGVTGGGDNSNQPGSDSYGIASSPSSGSSAGGDGSSDTAAASTGVNPLDPHATAMAAYNAALAGMGAGTGTGTGTPDATSGARPLLIRGRPMRQAAATPLYKPMEDPIIRRALGLE